MELWKIQNLTVEGKITIFKTLAISKTTLSFLDTIVLMEIINTLNQIQKQFILNGNKAKIKHPTLCKMVA